MRLAVVLIVFFAAATPAGLRAQDEPLEFDRTEVGWVPLIGGDTDFGYGVGVMGSLAGFEFDYEPYRYRLELVVLTLFRVNRDFRFLVPFQDYSFKATFPQLLFKAFRLHVGARYTRSATLLYPGIGNASVLDPELTIDERTYIRGEPRVFGGFSIRLLDTWVFGIQSTYTHNVIRYRPGSTLERDLQSGDPFLTSVLLGTDNHNTLLLEYSASYDSRDNEVSPKRGMFHELTLQHSPAPKGGGLLTLEWYRLSLFGRLYASLFEGRWAFAVRGIADVLFGDAPFYELARAGEKWAIGSAFGIRGIPGQRYYGKIKVMGNLETRVDLFGFQAWERRFRVGITGFADGGRVWTDFKSRPELDGRFGDWKYAAGGGLRLQQGEVFVVRADIAWSPWARPIGFYFGAGHMF